MVCWRGASVCVCVCVCRYLLMHSLTSSLSPYSLWNNNIGADGARALGDALKTNTTLTSLK